MSNNKPETEIRLGTLKATIWKNETKDGRAIYNTTYSRIYKVETKKKGDSGWRETSSFGRDDHLVLKKLSDIVHSFLVPIQQSEAQEV